MRPLPGLVGLMSSGPKVIFLQITMPCFMYFFSYVDSLSDPVN
jgi:hypothetical protein